jgi:hypothetical protein
MSVIDDEGVFGDEDGGMRRKSLLKKLIDFLGLVVSPGTTFSHLFHISTTYATI